MKNINFLQVVILMLALFVSVATTINLYKKNKILIEESARHLEIRLNEVIRARDYGWKVVNVAPDSIYFVTWGGDTSWYEIIR